MAKRLIVLVPMTRKQTSAVFQAISYCLNEIDLTEEETIHLEHVRDEIAHQRLKARWGGSYVKFWQRRQ